MPKSFAVVIPSYNNARWCRENLESVLGQEHPRFRILYTDDASADGTADLVADLIETHPRGHLIELTRNPERIGAVANIDRAIRESCDPSEIVVLVDGDDLLAHPRVLTRLEEIYRDPDVWVTWGQFVPFPSGPQAFCSPIPSEIVSANAYRDYPFVSSHLRTFYAGLYQRIRIIDVQDGGGRFFTTAGDVAQMFALMEMAGPRARFVPEVLYRYNRENPINDDKVDRAAQIRREMEIRGKARYGRLNSLAGTAAPREIYVGTGIGRSLFERSGPPADPDHRRRPFRQMRSVLNRLGYTLRESQTLLDVEQPHHVVVVDVRPEELERLAPYPPDLLSLVLWKDPIDAPHNFDRRHHERFGRIYTWCDDLIDDARYFKLRLPFLQPMIDDVVPFDKRKLCTLIATNIVSTHPDELYSEERRVAEFFAAAEPDSFDLFGRGWAGLNPSYRGVAVGRVERLRRYRFAFCYETVAGWNGYISAKIFDCFAAGCVPVYRGAPNVADSIPRECFIERNAFGSEAEVYEFLRDMTADEHARYLGHIRSFLASEHAALYSAEHFTSAFVRLVGGRAQRTADPGARGAGRSGDARARA